MGNSCSLDLPLLSLCLALAGLHAWKLRRTGLLYRGPATPERRLWPSSRMPPHMGLFTDQVPSSQRLREQRKDVFVHTRHWLVCPSHVEHGRPFLAVVGHKTGLVRCMNLLVSCFTGSASEAANEQD